jgi:hypothetical protein
VPNLHKPKDGFQRKEVPLSNIMKKRWIEMIEAFLKLTPEERSTEAEKR